MTISPDPEIFFSGPYVYFKNECFGIIRANLKAQGFKYTAKLSFEKSKIGRDVIRGVVANQINSNSITNVNCTVICSYVDEKGKDQEETLELKIPTDVLDLLSECPDGNVKSDPRCVPSEKFSGRTTTYYYSTCTGEILDTVRTEGDSTSAGC
jgi:hypothetical protein